MTPSASFLFFLFLALPLHAASVINPTPGPHPTFVPPPVMNLKSSLCGRECSNGRLALSFLQINVDQPASSTCPAHPDVTISCGGYSCENNGKLCKTSCAGPADCIQGSICVSNSCVPAHNRCSDDLLSVIDAEGRVYECGYYSCQAGACITHCTSSDQCRNGANCFIESGVCGFPPQTH